MQSFEGKKVLLVCSDPGAAQAVLLLHPPLCQRGATVTTVARHFGARLARQGSLPLEKRSLAYGGLQKVRRYLKINRPDCIITGTSLSDDLERNYIQEGKQLGIPTISFVDWWTRVKERFIHLRTYKAVVPDWICANNQQIAADLRKWRKNVRVRTVGHPYLSKIVKQPVLSWKSRQNLRRALRLAVPGKIVLFFPEPQFPPTGFDQFRIFTEILKAVRGVAHLSLNLILKFHPNGQQPALIRRYHDLVEQYGYPRLRVRFVLNQHPVLELIDLADLVWGMNTTPLLEAMLRGKLVSSFAPQVEQGVPFSKAAGFCPSAGAYSEIAPLVRALLTDSQFVRRAVARQKRYRLPQDDFIKSVISLIQSLV